MSDSFVALVIAREQNPDHPEADLLHVRCPFCHKIHTHGGERGHTGSHGHRVEHCHSGNGKGYMVEDPINE